jgi:aminopeptidase
MFNFKDFYKEENKKSLAEYEESIRDIREISAETGAYNKDDDKKGFMAWYHDNAHHILAMYELEKKLDADYMTTKTVDELKKENNSFYMELMGENYTTSYANPRFCVRELGNGFGQLYSFFHLLLRYYFIHSYKHKIFKMVETNRLFIESYRFIKEKRPAYDALKEIITRTQKKEDMANDYYYQLYENFHPGFSYFRDIVRSVESKDPGYLFRNWEHISDYEMETSRFLGDYPEETIEKMAQTMVNAYIESFKRDNKDMGNRTRVKTSFHAGLERIHLAVIRELEKRGLESCISNLSTTPVNRQYFYDHRFDFILYLDNNVVEYRLSGYKKAMEKLAGEVERYSGLISVRSFGEPPFSPVHKKENLKPTEEEQALFKEFQQKNSEIYYNYIPRTKTSFCIVAFPSPEIGDQYKEIFSDTVRINTLDSNTYEKIQQGIIDVLDTADTIHVRGKEGNNTDITIAMHEITDPATQTNFKNSGAHVNIPVGEVFTSPRLTGTNGTLHVKEVYLRSLRYDNLTLEFKDGYVTDYSCTNFKDTRENKTYIEENLLFPHKFLPMGEFAIGTNTLAYAVSRKYGIINKLPILIIEKMGPHFAIGDTCFSRREDHKIYNVLDGKEIIARGNEKSDLRKTDPGNAYTNIHTDISLPYDEIGRITAVTEQGEETDIIRDGRFVIKGTEALNEHLNTM